MTNSTLTAERSITADQENSGALSTRGSEVPSVSGGILWPDTTNKLFYLYGGEYKEPTDVKNFTSLWFFDVIYNTWNRTVTDSGTAYYYGGYLSKKNTPEWGVNPHMISSLISFDMDTKTWSNHTYDDNIPRAQGILQYLPVSTSGMLLYLGGLERGDSNGALFSDMATVGLFDINEKKWFTQKTTGEVPSPRYGMCAGLAWAKDCSSFNIYVQGGIAYNGTGFDDTYILSLPAFQWTLIEPQSGPMPNTAKGKGWSSCNVVRNMSQMIVLGGHFTDASYVACDSREYGGQHGLLLGQESAEIDEPRVKWWWRVTPTYNRYRVPDKVIQMIGGDIDGHATKTAPFNGWQTPQLSSYFQITMSATSRTATRPIPATATATSQSDPSGPNVGAIAGGTIGGLAALAMIAIIFFWLRPKRGIKATGNAPELDELDGPSVYEKPAENITVLHGSTIPSSIWHQGSSCAELPGSDPASAELPDARSPTISELPGRQNGLTYFTNGNNFARLPPRRKKATYKTTALDNSQTPELDDLSMTQKPARARHVPVIAPARHTLTSHDSHTGTMPSPSSSKHLGIDKLDYTSPRRPLLGSEASSTNGASNDNSYAGSFFEQVAEGVMERDRERLQRLAVRWLSFAWAIVNCLCAGSITAYSLYAPLFQSRLHYTQFQVNVVSIVAELGMYLLVPLFGYLCDRLGPGAPSALSGVFFGFGYLVAAFAYQSGPPAVNGWPFGFMVVAFFAIGMGTSCMYLSAVTTCAKNFGRGNAKGIALAVPIASFGLSGMWQSQVAAHLLYEKKPDGSKGDVDVFRFFLFLGIMLLAVGLIGTLTLRIIDEEELIDEAVEELERSGLLAQDEFFTAAANNHGYGTLPPQDLSDSTFDFLQHGSSMRRPVVTYSIQPCGGSLPASSWSPDQAKPSSTT
ncbi:hypothetical protein OPT61_g2273 [Boeremia exigua]|uniref:Uncharacterized protein n=1 Tax=Boeremia exigua TaxID=749465 RepID=A0ACC2IMA2_9PLEO|nr:hypothetical protein OPT61_g2273 [Boeremia exigua]